MGKILNSIKRVFGGKPNAKHGFLHIGGSYFPVEGDKFRDYNSFLDAGTVVFGLHSGLATLWEMLSCRQDLTLSDKVMGTWLKMIERVYLN